MRGDFFEGFSQESLVVTGDFGNYADYLVVQDVCGIELAAHANLDDAYLDLLLVEQGKGGGGKELELGGVDVLLLVQLQVAIFDCAKIPLRYRFVVDCDAVPSDQGQPRWSAWGGGLPVDHVRRGEATIFDQPACQEVARETTNRAFAIGAGYVDGLPRELDIMEQTADPLKPRLDHEGDLSGTASAA